MKKATELPLSIIEFIRHRKILNDNTNSPYQDVILKSIYGLELNESELKMFRAGTGRESYERREQEEATIIAGRRGGKTSRLAARIAIYEACRDHNIPPGEHALVVLIAPVLNQARLAFDFIRKDLSGSAILSGKIKSIKKYEIELKNGISIVCLPCSGVSVRGASVIGVICDEVAFWRNDDGSIHSDKEVLDAVRPAMITFPKRKLVKITTPYGKRGIVWEEYSQRSLLDFPVWQVSSAQLNPGIAHESEKVRQTDPELFRREYEAQFTDSLVSWIEHEALLPCIMKDRSELPPVSNVNYVACIDPAFKQSDFALAISHRTETGRIVLDLVRRWCGSKEAPLGFERVCREVADILVRFDITRVRGDQYAAPAIKNEMGKMGIQFEETTFVGTTRAKLFNNLKHLITQRKIELLDDPEMWRQLLALEEERSRDGRIDVRPAKGKDDLAVVVAMTASDLCEISTFASPIISGRVSRSWDGQLASINELRGGFPVGTNCAEFPNCFERNSCECYGI